MVWHEVAFQTGISQSAIFGANIRAMVSSITKTADMANGVFDKRIDTRRLSAGGSTALYTQGVPLDVIQSWGRWASPTPHRYLWRDDTALKRLSEVEVKSHGLLECLELMNKPINNRISILSRKLWITVMRRKTPRRQPPIRRCSCPATSPATGAPFRLMRRKIFRHPTSHRIPHLRYTAKT